MRFRYLKSGATQTLPIPSTAEANALRSWIRYSSPKDTAKAEVLPDDLLFALFRNTEPAGRNWEYFLAFQDIHLNYQHSTHVAGEIGLYADRVFLINHHPRTKAPHTFSQEIMMKHSRMSEAAAPHTALRDEFWTTERNLGQYIYSYYSGFEALVFPGGKNTWVLRNIISKFMDNAYAQLGKRAPRMPNFWEV